MREFLLSVPGLVNAATSKPQTEYQPLPEQRLVVIPEHLFRELMDRSYDEWRELLFLRNRMEIYLKAGIINAIPSFEEHDKEPVHELKSARNIQAKAKRKGAQRKTERKRERKTVTIRRRR